MPALAKAGLVARISNVLNLDSALTDVLCVVVAAACIDIAVTRSVDVTLESPLGDRVVLDGSREQVEIARADAPYGDGGEGEPAN